MSSLKDSAAGLGEAEPTVMDNSSAYGRVSRYLHWGMAALFLVQLSSSGARYLFEDTAIEQLLWPSHSQIGAILLLLVFLRGVWAILNLSRRPSHPQNFWGLAALLGHSALYLLMIIVPILAILRSYGSGRGLDMLGIEVFARTGTVQVEWMDKAGDALHSELGWIFFAIVTGHAFAALLHPQLEGHAVMPRMGVTKGPGTRDAR